MRPKMFLMLAVLMLAAASAHAQIQTPPPGTVTTEEHGLFDAARLSFAVGLNREFYTGNDPEPADRWAVGVYGAYNLVPSVDLTGSVSRPVSDQDGVEDAFRWQFGVRLVLWRGVH